jgi:hypothetical protein
MMLEELQRRNYSAITTRNYRGGELTPPRAKAAMRKPSESIVSCSIATAAFSDRITLELSLRCLIWR